MAPRSRALRFDPLERRFLFPRDEPSARAGPVSRRTAGARPSRAFRRDPSSVGPADAGAESVWGAGRAAAEAAIESGRAVYLLDPDPEAVPPAAGDAAVILCSWRPGAPERAFPALERFRRRGAPLRRPVSSDSGLDRRGRSDRGSRGGGGPGRSRLADGARARGRRRGAAGHRRGRVRATSPTGADRFFEVIHHGDWPERLAGRVAAARKAASEQGPPAPAAAARRPGSSPGATGRPRRGSRSGPSWRIRASTAARSCYAAIRWIDESPRDLSAVAREGNFRKVFPFDGEVAGVGRGGAHADAVPREPDGEPARPGSTSTSRTARPAAATARSS